MHEELEKSANKRNETEDKLKQQIMDLIKEQYRLSGMVWYPLLDPTLDPMVKGGDGYWIISAVKGG